MAKRRTGLRGSESDHVAGAKRELDAAWTHLENLPPTCEGGIQRAAQALGGFARASVHLDQISDRATRDVNTDLYGMRNIGEKAAWDATRFYSHVCKAPHREVADRPLTSRAKAMEILRPKPKRKRRR
jgi:hypothetical protein